MEDNLHQDDLNDFLNNSFEDYSDSPDTDVWDRISSELDQKEKKQRGFFWIFPIGGALLFGLLYFSIENNQLRQELNIANKIINKTQEKATLNAYEVQPNLPETDVLDIATPLLQSKELKEELNIKSTEKTIPAIPEADETLNSVQKSFEIIFDNSDEIRKRNPIAQFEAIPSLLLQPAWDQQKPVLYSNIEIATQSSKESNSRFSIGVDLMALNQETSLEVQQGFPTPGPGSKRIFYPGFGSSGYSTMTGVKLGYNIRERWTINSGIYYQQKVLSTTHQPRFKFFERINPNFPNPQSGQHEFEYTLYTSDGELDVTLRTDQVDGQQEIPDEENIDLYVSLSRVTNYLSIPLTINREYGTGRWKLQTWGGIRINIPVHSKTAVTNSYIQNDFFNQDIPKIEVKQNSLNVKPRLDLLAGVGISYAVNNLLSFHLQPSISISPSRSNFNNKVKSSERGIGINAGLKFNL